MIGQNLQYLRKKNNLSQQGLSEILGIPRTTLGDYERSKTEPNLELLVKISHHFKVSIEDLLLTDLSLDKYELSHASSFKVLAITVDDDNESHIQLVESKAEAGYLDAFQNPEFIKELPQIKIPNIPKGTYRAFEITGDSMYPIESGSIIICSYVEKISDIKDDKTYVLISHKDGLVYKRVKKLQDQRKLLLSSDNSYYLPYHLAYEDIFEIWQYYAHVSFSDKLKEDSDRFRESITELHVKVNDIHKKMLNK